MRMALAGRRQAVALVLATAVLTAGCAALLAAPLVDGLRIWDFTLDDAFISYRYADHLASGDGPVWNVDEDPVEGYTSFSWVVMVAAAMALGADPVIAAKVLSVFALAALVAIFLVWRGRDGPLLRIVAVGGLLLSPAFLVVTTQGLETALAALLATVGGVLVIDITRRPTHGRLAAYTLVALLATLTRPDLLAFFGITTVGLLILLRRDRAALVRMVAWLGAVAVVPGGAYLAWRWTYYGYPLPNTFYVKTSDALVDPLGAQLVGAFLKDMASPYLLVLAILGGRLVILRRRGATSGRSDGLEAVVVLLVAVVAFLLAWMTFTPLQGVLYRFQMPVYPVLLLLLLATGLAQDPPDWLRQPRPLWRALALGATAVLAVLPLHMIGEARLEVGARWQHDREVVGRSLASLSEGGRSRMLVTESGALPFYCGWRATDLLGLNDEHIAHEGLSADYLARLAPDLVMASVRIFEPKQFQPVGDYAVLAEMLRDRKFALAAAVVKTDSRRDPSGGLAHFYFVPQSSPKSRAIVSTLRGLDLVPLDRAGTEAIRSGWGVPRWTGPRRLRASIGPTGPPGVD